MLTQSHTADELDAEKLTLVRELSVGVFALHGALVETGNRLVRHAGLTTAWWQVLGALGHAPAPLPVASIARDMGLSRQSVQRVVDLLIDRGLVRLEDNPHHKRARLVVLTTNGQAALAAAEEASTPMSRLALERIGADRIAAAIRTLADMNALLTEASPDLGSATPPTDQGNSA
jgi:DNA-binding MarR family transcriptional regulator